MSGPAGVDVDGYLARLGLAQPQRPAITALRVLHLAHMRAVPFENSSVLRGEPIHLDEAELVDRIAAGRGGFCYQLNGAFGALLEALGYSVERLPARFHSDAGLEPRLGHLTLRVMLDEPWLVDVGGGLSFSAPLRLAPDIEQDDPTGRFRIVRAAPADDDPGEVFDVEWQHRDGGFRPHFRFEPIPHALEEFAATCEWTRTSPASPFTTGWRCARRLDDGWATLDGRRLVVTGASRRDDRQLDDPAALDAALAEWFGMAPAV